MLKINAITQHARSERIILAMDSNSSSTLWHDEHTNTKGRILEELITRYQLHTLNEFSDYSTFNRTRCNSKIDLTIVNTPMLRTVNEWEIWDQEILSEHKIVRLTICQFPGDNSTPRTQEPRYIVERRSIKKIQSKFIRLTKAIICTTHKEKDTVDLVSKFVKLVKPQSDI